MPSAVLPGYGGKPWHLVPSLLEDRLTGSTEGTEWGRRDNVSADGAVTKFGQIDAHKDKEAKVWLGLILPLPLPLPSPLTLTNIRLG